MASSGDRGWTESGLKGPIWVIWRGRQPALLMRPGYRRRCCAYRAVVARAGVFRGAFRPACAAIGRYIARRLGPDAADDLVAETFLVAFRRRGHYDLAHGDARPWLYGIATRLIGRHRRAEVRFFRAIARTGVDPAAEPIADQVTDRIAAQAARRDLAAALARLSQDQRDVLLLVASGGLGYEETALALEVPAGTVFLAAGPRAPEGPRGAWRAGPHPPGRGCTVMDEMEQLERMCAAVPPPDRQRLAQARAQLITAITASRRPAAGHGTRGPWLAISLKLRRRWLGWAAPLAAAAAVVGVILGTQGVVSTVHSPAPAASGHGPGAGSAHPVTAYVAGQSGMVTPILTASNTALAPIRIGKGPWCRADAVAIAFLPDGKTAYVLTNTLLGGPGTVTPIRTATNTALKPIKSGTSPVPSRSPRTGRPSTSPTSARGTVTPIRTATNTALQHRSRSDGARVPSRSPRTGRPPTSPTTGRAR